MGGKTRIMLIVLVVVIATISIVAILVLSDSKDNFGESNEKVTFEVICPEGVTFDKATGTLSSDEEVEWIVTDMLVPFVNRTDSVLVGTVLALEPGYYKVKASASEFFDVAVAGKVQRTASWEFYKDGKQDVTVTFEIDLLELAEMTVKNNLWNKPSNWYFSNLQDKVYVNDTIRSIESQMSKAYKDMGGNPKDRQAYADFLVTFAQKAVKYPTKVSGHDEDYYLWGDMEYKYSDTIRVSEYWANPLQTLFYMMGDCEDSSAVACSLFKAAGYKTAMVGLSGHVTAAVSLDSFEECDMDEFSTYNSHSGSFKVAEGRAVGDSGTGPMYYGVDTIMGQVPVGYMLKSDVDSFGNTVKNMADFSIMGVAGFYPVP